MQNKALYYNKSFSLKARRRGFGEVWVDEYEIIIPSFLKTTPTPPYKGGALVGSASFIIHSKGQEVGEGGLNRGVRNNYSLIPLDHPNPSL